MKTATEARREITGGQSGEKEEQGGEERVWRHADVEGEAHFFLFLSFPLQRMQRDRENEGELLQPKVRKHTNTDLSIFPALCFLQS